MPATYAQPSQRFTLTAHAATPCPAVRHIHGTISRTSSGLRVSYMLEGDIASLRVPANCTPRFIDHLWRHTCFELFIARKGEAAYREFNFSPSGAWAAYAFTNYREGEDEPALARIDPGVTARRSADTLALEARVPLEALTFTNTEAPLTLGLSAVVEDKEGNLSYWALMHPLDKPDFHQRAAFALELHEVRN